MKDDHGARRPPTSKKTSSIPKSDIPSKFWPPAKLPPKSSSNYYTSTANKTVPTTSQNTPSNQQKSWRDICSMGQSLDQDCSLHYVPPKVVEGRSIVEISYSAITDAISQWSNTLIGYVVGQRPYYNHLKSTLMCMWAPSGKLEIYARENGYFIFKFQESVDCQKVTSGGHGCTMVDLLF